MTLSIVARDFQSGDFGVCGYTDIAGYGSLVPHVSTSGAVATQAYVNVDNGIELMELIDKKLSVNKAGNIIIKKDMNKEMRQMVAIGLNNSYFEWTGVNTLDYKSSIKGNNYIVAGNCMNGQNVLKACADYYENNLNENFPLRLINSIKAGDQEGGHTKKISYFDNISKKKITRSTKTVFGEAMSSALIIASKSPQIWHNLRVDSHKKPIQELKKIYFSSKISSDKLNKFYDGAIKVNPYYWRRIN